MNDLIISTWFDEDLLVQGAAPPPDEGDQSNIWTEIIFDEFITESFASELVEDAPVVVDEGLQSNLDGVQLWLDEPDEGFISAFLDDVTFDGNALLAEEPGPEPQIEGEIPYFFDEVTFDGNALLAEEPEPEPQIEGEIPYFFDDVTFDGNSLLAIEVEEEPSIEGEIQFPFEETPPPDEGLQSNLNSELIEEEEFVEASALIRQIIDDVVAAADFVEGLLASVDEEIFENEGLTMAFSPFFDTAAPANVTRIYLIAG